LIIIKPTTSANDPWPAFWKGTGTGSNARKQTKSIYGAKRRGGQENLKRLAEDSQPSQLWLSVVCASLQGCVAL
jgi:hypothetical protein